MVTEIPPVEFDPWHELLTTRYVCEICLTRYFKTYRYCPACHRLGRIRPLVSMLLDVAHDDEELRTMITHGQTLAPTTPVEENIDFDI